MCCFNMVMKVSECYKFWNSWPKLAITSQFLPRTEQVFINSEFCFSFLTPLDGTSVTSVRLYCQRHLQSDFISIYRTVGEKYRPRLTTPSKDERKTTLSRNLSWFQLQKTAELPFNYSLYFRLFWGRDKKGWKERKESLFFVVQDSRRAARRRQGHV